MSEGLLLEAETLSKKTHYLIFTGYSRPYCVNQIHPWTLWCTFLYTAFPLSPEVQQDSGRDSYDCFQLLKEAAFIFTGRIREASCNLESSLGSKF